MINMKQQKFSWSLSRDNLLSSCEKKYGYHYYVAQNGWSFKASKQAQKAFQLKKLATPEMLAGKIIHELIEDVFRALLDLKHVPSEKELFDKFGSLLREEYKKNKDSLFHNHYEETNDSLEEIIERYSAVFSNFFQSNTWKMVTDDPSSYDVVSFEEFETFEIDDVTIYAIMDLVIHDIGNDLYYIIDWKTGKKGYHGTAQLMLYKIHFLSKHEDIESERVFCVNEYLRLNDYVIFNPEEEELQHLLNSMFLPSVERMKGLLTSVESNTPMPIEMFKGCNVRAVCELCNFKEMCKPKILEEDNSIYDKFFE